MRFAVAALGGFIAAELISLLVDVAFSAVLGPDYAEGIIPLILIIWWLSLGHWLYRQIDPKRWGEP